MVHHLESLLRYANLRENLIRVIILDLSGIYVQIHNQGYFDKESISETLDEIVDVANYFQVSLDDLIGYSFVQIIKSHFR